MTTPTDPDLAAAQARRIAELEQQLREERARHLHYRELTHALDALLAESRRHAAELEARLEEIRAAVPCCHHPHHHPAGLGLAACVKALAREHTQLRRELLEEGGGA